MNQNVADHYDGMARWYEILDWAFERFRYRQLRPEVWNQATGRTLELGVGTGLNIPFHPAGMEVVGIDSSEGMLTRARARAKVLGRQMEFHCMDARILEFPDASFDSAVATFLFCVLPDSEQPGVLAQIQRVLRPGGRLVLLEYVYSQNPIRRMWMRLQAPLVRRLYLAGFDRQTRRHLDMAGWKVVEDCFLWKDVIRLIVAAPPRQGG